MNSGRNYYDNYWKSGGAGGYSTPNMRRWSAERKRLLIKTVETLPEDASVLDAGCGAGEFSRLLSEKRLKVVGIDLSPIPLMEIDRTPPSTMPLNFAAASVEGNLPFADNSFSAIWTTEVVEHVLDVRSTFSEFSRVLQPQGLLILTTPYHSMVKNLVLVLTNFDKHFDPTGPHIRFYTTKSLQRCATEAGFHVVSMRGIGRFWPLWMSHFMVARKM